MNKIFFALLIFLLCGPVLAQVHYSGAYGYSLPPKNTAMGKQATGPSGQLVLLQMENNKYRFWLEITIGSPSNNLGETDGTITWVNDTASFEYTFEEEENPCILNFRLSGDVITINSTSSSSNCGFGNGVYANGEYTRMKSQPVFNNEWLKNQYQESARVIITAPKAEIFQDENGIRSFPKSQYIVKGDSLINIAETERTVYTEFFTPSGKFMYGWIRKKDLKKVDAN